MSVLIVTFSKFSMFFGIAGPNALNYIFMRFIE